MLANRDERERERVGFPRRRVFVAYHLRIDEVACEPRRLAMNGVGRLVPINLIKCAQNAHDYAMERADSCTLHAASCGLCPCVCVRQNEIRPVCARVRFRHFFSPR